MSETPYIDKDNVLHILGEKVLPRQHKRLNLHTAKLYTTTLVDIPVIIQRAKKKGPVVLITAGIHGDEINGVEIVRQIISKKINKPRVGTIICIPILNIFGFLNMQREFPDGRDLNRVFPGSQNGPLANRFAYQLTTEILPVVNYAFDFHTGGAKRFNAAQVRITNNQIDLLQLAKVFSPPFIVFSTGIKKSYRMTCYNNNIPILLFEGGKSTEHNQDITNFALSGMIRVLNHLGMLRKNIDVPNAEKQPVLIQKTKWLRAKYSGLLQVKISIGQWIDKKSILAEITDPYGSFKHLMKAKESGYIINVNQSPIIHQGDAIFHISTKVDDKA